MSKKRLHAHEEKNASDARPMGAAQVEGRPAARGSVRRVEDVRQLKVLFHPLRLRILEEMDLRGRATPTQIARALGESAPKIHYHVKELLKVGLVEEVEIKPKGGVLEHYYRAVADSFEVPGDIAVKAGGAGLHGFVSAEIGRLWSEAVEAVTAHSEQKAKAAKGGQAPRVFAGISHSYLQLTKKLAEEVWQRVAGVLKEYESDEGTEPGDADDAGGADGEGGDGARVYGIITALYPVRRSRSDGDGGSGGKSGDAK